LAKGETQQSNRDNKSQRHWRMGGIVTNGREVDTPANKRQCHNKRHGEEEEGADAMATMKEDAAGIVTVVVVWADEDNETR
jgi:hypothetical protein